MNEDLVWDLIVVSKEEFQARVDEAEHPYASPDTELYEDIMCFHYYDINGLYLGTLKASDDGTEYLIPEKVFEDEIH